MGASLDATPVGAGVDTSSSPPLLLHALSLPQIVAPLPAMSTSPHAGSPPASSAAAVDSGFAPSTHTPLEPGEKDARQKPPAFMPPSLETLLRSARPDCCTGRYASHERGLAALRIELRPLKEDFAEEVSVSARTLHFPHLVHSAVGAPCSSTTNSRLPPVRTGSAARLVVGGGVERAVQLLQSVVNAHGGAIISLTIAEVAPDSTPISALAVFGLTGVDVADPECGSHPTWRAVGPLSALRCAISLRCRSHRVRMVATTAIATGDLWVGTAGLCQRRAWMAIGRYLASPTRLFAEIMCI